MTLAEVVSIIFEKNPTDVKQHYENQIDLYSKVLKKVFLNGFTLKAQTSFVFKSLRLKRLT